MKKKIAKTLIRGKLTVLACVVVATVFGASSALAANGGNLILAANNTATLATFMTATVPGSASLIINNPSTTAGSTALDLRVSSGKAPLKVNSDVKVTNLNSDKLDGKDSSAFVPSKTYIAKDLRQGSGNGTVEIRVARCDAGDKLLGGGGGPETGSLDPLIESRPEQGSQSWRVKVQDNGSPDLIDAAAVCADFTP